MHHQKQIWISGLAILGVRAMAGTVVYQTSFEGAWFTDPGQSYAALPAASYLTYFNDGTQGTVTYFPQTYDWNQARSAGTLGDGWTVLPAPGAFGSVDLVGSMSPWVDPSPSLGIQWIDLQGTPGPGGIERSLDVHAGATYIVTWWDWTNGPLHCAPTT